MTAAAPAAPAGKDRIDLIDALRGVALLGIFLANVTVLSGWVMMSPEARVALAGADMVQWQQFLTKVLIDGKFYTLFSLLFGIGFSLQLDRSNRRGIDGMRIYRRRALILLAIGMAHLWLIWDGDILVLYALLGLILPFFHRLPDRTLLILSAILIFAIPFAGVALVRAMGWPADAGLIGLSDRIAVAIATVEPKDGVGWLRREDLDARLAWNISGPFFSWGLKLMSWRIAKVLGIMLLGMWIGRRLAQGTLFSNRRLLWRVLIVGLAIGVPASIAYGLQPGQVQSDWRSMVGTVPLALAYASAFALAWPHAARALGILAPAGRMALTNYLAQSVICVIVFYGIGFGQAGYWPPALFYTFAIALFAAQVAFSYWWLTQHDQGPMEALWRRWTYRNPTVTGAVPAV